MGFCANTTLYFNWMVMLEFISMIPLVMAFKMFGVETFQKMKYLGEMFSVAGRGIRHPFEVLTKDLKIHEGPYLCGDQYTLADVSLVPIFERMHWAGWWTDELKAKFPEVTKYWENIQERGGYKASKPDQPMMDKLVRSNKLIEQWKTEYHWFNNYYKI